jgi:hypothetical protein
MRTATGTKESAARFLQARVVAVRAEMSDVQELIDAGMHKAEARTMLRALKRDLLGLEKRLAEVIA